MFVRSSLHLSLSNGLSWEHDMLPLKYCLQSLSELGQELWGFYEIYMPYNFKTMNAQEINPN